MSHALLIKICLWIAFTKGGKTHTHTHTHTHIYIYSSCYLVLCHLDGKVSLDDSMASLLCLNDY
jgi:hypothetical protein